MNNEKREKNTYLLKRLFAYIRPYMPLYILAQIIGILAIVVEMMGPVILSGIVNILTRGNATLKIIVSYATLYLGVSVFLVSILLFMQMRILNYIGQEASYKIRNDVFEHILNMSHKEFLDIPTGKLVTRLTSDTNAINELFTKTLTKMISNIVTLITALVIMLIISLKLSLIILIITPVILLITYMFAAYSKHKYRIVREASTAQNTFLSENIDGIRVVKAYSREEAQYERFIKLNKKVMVNNLTQTTVFAIFRPLIYSIHLICVLLLLYYGGMLALNGSAAPGIIVAFHAYSSYYFDPIQDIAEQLNSFQDSMSSVEKVFNILDIKSSIVEDDNPIELEKINGKIEFRNVYFRYNSKQDYILNDVSFIINPGETIALVGPTGGGKSTIINLIERNYDIESGMILIDDIDIKKISLKSLRKNIGVMLQEVHLFSGSVRDNITLFDDINDEDVKRAASMVYADRIIEELPDKYDTLVSAKGANFSQGERQLLSFARAIAPRPSMMILDEATANIDSKTESIIQQSLVEMKQLGTMIIVAHRLSTIKHSSRIFVISCGKIVEEGTHDSLIEKKGMYYTLYESQYKEV